MVLSKGKGIKWSQNNKERFPVTRLPENYSEPTKTEDPAIEHNSAFDFEFLKKTTPVVSEEKKVRGLFLEQREPVEEEPREVDEDKLDSQDFVRTPNIFPGGITLLMSLGIGLFLVVTVFGAIYPSINGTVSNSNTASVLSPAINMLSLMLPIVVVGVVASVLLAILR